MASSYPYLNVAREFGLDYGDLLHYATALERLTADPRFLGSECPQEQAAITRMNDRIWGPQTTKRNLREAINEAFYGEMRRRMRLK